MYLLRLTFKSFQKINQLKQNLLKLKKFNKFLNTKINGIFQTKKKKKIFTVLRSPHVNKKSREQFIYNNYTPKIDIKFINIFQLLNFLILIKKILSENTLINVKIIKKN
uniref:40S ribosomal protein S10 n=1 Tax=Phytophthora cambivora TaxID=53983 RepID=G4X6I5_9STRA|nr:ribosomal protein S10 [Phytophthora cambivora]AEP41371.1 40S ribosomal protein S10 [Phytophthora cambivora]UNW58212.1 40S ribosomal protein S10 [Phytophthora x cambivora]UXG53564.1 ribosomal protein S10 [Phytophthora cambivora]DAZ89417.1 TPA_asm: ribosomal protein S10 [Phytophthora cambivora]